MAAADEYEYEYSTTETESFLVDLDLSSVNGTIKSGASIDKQSLGGQKAVKHGKMAGQSPTRPQAEDNEDEGVDGAATPTQQQTQSPQDADMLDDSEYSVQILDLHTHNPIVSYRNSIYSCYWTDMIGTNMFFTQHQETPLHEPEISTEDYDLIGTSRIKLVGRRAKVEAKTQVKKRKHADDESEVESPVEPVEQYVPAGRSLGGIKRTNPKANAAIKQQASFLEKLMDIKKAKGEHDTVRTFVDRHMIAAETKQKEGTNTSQKEIEDLNRRVVQGDNKALERLQEIYSRMEEVESSDDDRGVQYASSASVLVPSVARNDDNNTGTATATILETSTQ